MTTLRHRSSAPFEALYPTASARALADAATDHADESLSLVAVCVLWLATYEAAGGVRRAA